MTTQRAMVKPVNAIVLDSQNMHIQTMNIKTATNMYAGRLVKRGTGDHDIVVNTAAGAAVGWLGYEQTTKKHRPATVDTIYLITAQAAMLWGPGMIILGTLDAGCTTTKGTRLKAGANGTLTGGTVGTDEIVAIAEETGTSGSDCLVRSLI